MNKHGWIPEGSTVIENPNETLSIIPPPGWSYAGTLENGGISIIAAGDGTVSCTCKATGTCLPFTASGPKGSTSGCAGTCTDCSMKQSVAGNDFQSGGYLNFNMVPAIILVGQEYPAAFKEMYEVPQVNTKIQQFYTQYFHEDPIPILQHVGEYLVAPPDYLLAMVNICGRAMPLVIPQASMIAGGAGGSAASCSCTQGSCELKESNIPFVGGVKYCEGTCTGTCSLKTSVAVGGQVTYTAQTFYY